MKSVAFHNLGCKVNAYEIDVMQDKLTEKGYKVVPFDEDADIYVINTCTVTNIADRKSRQMLHRAKKKNPNAVVIAVGCYVETDPDRIQMDEAIDLAIGNNKKGQIAELLDEFLEERGDKTLDGKSMEDLTKAPAFESMQLRTPGHTRAYIKIQDGCNQFCSYCIIPYARGRVRSRQEAEILEEITALANQGIKEVVLTGIHIGSYGIDRGGSELLSLLQKIQEIPGLSRIRLGSLEPRIMTEDFVKGIAALSKVCPHFHLSLQSGANATLKRMNRHYTAEEFLACVERLRKHYDRPALTTDVIVGFPGETEEEFAETMDFLRKVNFYEIHVFKYSVRHGTVAEGLPDQCTEALKEERSAIVQELTAQQASAYRDSFVGEKEELLLEEPVSVEGVNYMVGHTMRYVEGVIACDKREDLQSGHLVSGTFREKMEGTSYLLFEDEDTL